MLNFLLLLAIVFGVCFGITYSALSSTKTATGVISIVMPPTSGTTCTSLYIDTNNSAVYLSNDDSGTQITSSTTLLPKLVLVDTQSGSSAYIKIEISVLGVTNLLSYNESGTIATFSDGVAMTCTQTTSLITLTTSTAVSEYSYIFLDSIIANLQTSGQLINATLQFKIYSSLDSSFVSNSVNNLILNLNSCAEIITITFSGDTYGVNDSKTTLPSSVTVNKGDILKIVYYSMSAPYMNFYINDTLIYNGSTHKDGMSTDIRVSSCTIDGVSYTNAEITITKSLVIECVWKTGLPW